MQTRRFPRYAVDRPLTAVLYWEETPIRRVHGRCRILAEGGLGATLADELYLGEVVRLEIPPALNVYASVRDTRGNHHGFEFLFLNDRQRQIIRHLCNSSLPSET